MLLEIPIVLIVRTGNLGDFKEGEIPFASAAGQGVRFDLNRSRVNIGRSDLEIIVVVKPDQVFRRDNTIAFPRILVAVRAIKNFHR